MACWLMSKAVRYGSGTARRGVLALLFWLAGVFPACPASEPASCQPHPKGEWIAESDLRQMLEEYGYVIRELGVKDDCFEMQGENAEREHVRLRMDTQTGDVVLSEQDEEPDQ